MFLPDVNLWLALVFDAHVHHSAAKSWYDGLSGVACFFCRTTQQGFLRLATNPKAFGGDAVSLIQAWSIYDTILNDPHISFVDEPSTVESLWRGYTQGQTFSPKVWNDAFLAAFAQAAGYELITFDKGFSRYADLNCTILS